MAEKLSPSVSAAPRTIPSGGGVERFGVRPIESTPRVSSPRLAVTQTPRGEIGMFRPSTGRKSGSVLGERVVSKTALKETRPVWSAPKKKELVAAKKPEMFFPVKKEIAFGKEKPSAVVKQPTVTIFEIPSKRQQSTGFVVEQPKGRGQRRELPRQNREPQGAKQVQPFESQTQVPQLVQQPEQRTNRVFRTSAKQAERRAHGHREVGRSVRYPEAQAAQIVSERPVKQRDQQVAREVKDVRRLSGMPQERQRERQNVSSRQTNENRWGVRAWERNSGSNNREQQMRFHAERVKPQREARYSSVEVQSQNQRMETRRALSPLEQRRRENLKQVRSELKVMSSLKPKTEVSSLAQQVKERQQRLERLQQMQTRVKTLQAERKGQPVVAQPAKLLQEKMAKQQLHEERKLLRTQERMMKRQSSPDRISPMQGQQMHHVKDLETNTNRINAFKKLFIALSNKRPHGVDAQEIVARMPSPDRQPRRLRSKLIRDRKEVIEVGLEYVKYLFGQSGKLKTVDDVHRSGTYAIDTVTAVEHGMEGNKVTRTYVKRFITGEEPEPLPQTTYSSTT